MGEGKQNINVVSGNGKDLDISSVSSHIPASKPKIRENENEKIIIPKEKKKRSK